tara:strand:- start:427 stop:714 length:288 start_codon:yes stop_codon:yes gene_type:complete
MEKKYLNGVFIREKVFDNGGEILNLSVLGDQFMRQLKDIMVEKGNVNINLVISRRKEVTDTGISHSMYVDTYEPKDYNDTNNPQQDKKDTEDLPF